MIFRHGAPPAFVIVEQQANIASSDEHEGTWKILDIYPNPVSNLLFYNIKSEEFGLTADIFTICGEKIQSLALYANHTAINVENLLPGIYMLQVKSEKSGISENHKFVKM